VRGVKKVKRLTTGQTPVAPTDVLHANGARGRRSEHDRTGQPRPQSTTASKPDGESLPAERPNLRAAQTDYRLAQRCLAGEVAAWEALYARCHTALLISVRILLGGAGADADLVDEIAARVWYTLVAEDGEILARYSPDRGARLITFMRAIAKDLACRYFRSERRRRRRQAVAVCSKLWQGKVPNTSVESNPSVDEFLGTLDSSERQFCDEHLLDLPGTEPDDDGQGPSPVSIWRWSRRIYQKLSRFLARG
jgi:DNA-directed RNA polymerase specialized sigma24 family protein